MEMVNDIVIAVMMMARERGADSVGELVFTGFVIIFRRKRHTHRSKISFYVNFMLFFKINCRTDCLKLNKICMQNNKTFGWVQK